MHRFYHVIKRIHQFAANLLSYIPTKYYWNRSTPDLVIVKSKRVNFILKHSVDCYNSTALLQNRTLIEPSKYWPTAKVPYSSE